MEAKVVAVCTIVGLLGLLSAGLGFAAEATNVKKSQIIPDVVNDVCAYPKSPASTLGFISALLLLVSLIITNSASGCFCCYTKRSEYPRFFKLSWSTFVTGFALMVGAAVLSQNTFMSKLRTQDKSYGTYYYCYYVKPGVFAVAACLSLISVISGLVCYISLDTASRKGGEFNGAEIVVGQPQIPRSQPIVGQPQPSYV